VNKKTAGNAGLIACFQGQELDAHYLAFFACFNRGDFYEAHDVLEELWLPERRRPDGDFFKGLIQLAGAFVHVRKNRPGPALALLALARGNLAKYPDGYFALDFAGASRVMDEWSATLRAPSVSRTLWPPKEPPQLRRTAVR